MTKACVWTRQQQWWNYFNRNPLADRETGIGNDNKQTELEIEMYIGFPVQNNHIYLLKVFLGSDTRLWNHAWTSEASASLGLNVKYKGFQRAASRLCYTFPILPKEENHLWTCPKNVMLTLKKKKKKPWALTSVYASSNKNFQKHRTDFAERNKPACDISHSSVLRHAQARMGFPRREALLHLCVQK